MAATPGEIVKASKLTQYRICKETGIGPASLSRFMSRERHGLWMDAFNKLGLLLKLRIVSDQKGE